MESTLGIHRCWADAIKSGKKTVEGRLCRPGSVAANVQVNDVLTFVIRGTNCECFSAIVLKVTHYNTTDKYLKSEGLNNCLPGVATIEEGIAIYREFYSEKDEQQYGMVAIEIGVLPWGNSDEHNVM